MSCYCSNIKECANFWENCLKYSCTILMSENCFQAVQSYTKCERVHVYVRVCKREKMSVYVKRKRDIETHKANPRKC